MNKKKKFIYFRTVKIGDYTNPDKAFHCSKYCFNKNGDRGAPFIRHKNPDDHKTNKNMMEFLNNCFLNDDLATTREEFPNYFDCQLALYRMRKIVKNLFMEKVRKVIYVAKCTSQKKIKFQFKTPTKWKKSKLTI